MQNGTYRIFAINPGSTSTKLGLFDGDSLIVEETIRHKTEELSRYRRVAEQEKFRRDLVMNWLGKKISDGARLHAVVARGGVLRPIPGGTYSVNHEMLEDLREAKYGEHASNLGAMIAHYIAKREQIPAFIVDPVVVDEMEPVARISGIPSIERKSIFHALNQKAVAREIAKKIGKPYEACRFVVAHMGGGITVGAHCEGRVVDVNNGLNGEGPFSPQRAGTIPFGDLIQLSFSGKYFPREVMQMLVGQGGMAGYLGTHDAMEVERRIEAGDQYALLIYEAMAYQVAKEIAACAAVLKGRVDRIILTGGLAYGEKFVTMIKERIDWIAPVVILPGENELKALTRGALRVLRGEETARTYPQPVKGRSKVEVNTHGGRI